MKQCEIGDFHATQWNEKILGKFKKSFLLTFLLKKVRRKTLTSLLLRRIRVDSKNCTSHEVESSSPEELYPTRKRGNP
jgi:hypothetical protein